MGKPDEKTLNFNKGCDLHCETRWSSKKEAVV